MDERFAVVRTEDCEVDNREIAQLLADLIEVDVADMIHTLPTRSGIIAENLFEHTAVRCIAWLAEAGIKAQVVPQSGIVEPPEFVTLRSGAPADEVFFYVAEDRKGVVKWSEVIWIDFVAVMESSMEEFEDWDISRDGERPGVRRFKSERLVTKTPGYLDLIIYEPWMALRIPQATFDFTSTMLPILPGRRQNLVELAAAIASRATSAQCGLGMEWVHSDSPPREFRVPNKSVYHGFLRWQLTRLFLN